MLNTIKGMWSRFQNREFMEAVVAGCVLVAAADGQVDPSEKQKMMGLIQHIEELKHFNFPEVAASFSHCVEILSFDFTVGKEELFKRIRKVKENGDVAKTVIRICCSIGEADGNFDVVEKNMVREMCHQLNLNPSNFEL